MRNNQIKRAAHGTFPAALFVGIFVNLPRPMIRALSGLTPTAKFLVDFLKKIDLDSVAVQLVLCLPNGVNHRSAVS